MDAMIPAVFAAFAALVQLLLVATHPEPTGDDPDIAHKPSYRSLVTWPAATSLCLAATMLGTLCAALGIKAIWTWAVWAGAGLVLVWVDARSTWLPRRCTALLWTGLFGTLAVHCIGAPNLVFALLIGATASAGIFAIFWLLTRSLGFGDVHLAGMVGALGALHGLSGWSITMLVGTATAALWGIATTIWRRHHPHPLGSVFAYGPGLWCGPWVLVALYPS